MIAKVAGTLETVAADRATVTVAGGFTLEVLLPAATAAQLTTAEGQPITLHTHFFLESLAQGANMIPRLAGFLTLEDRRFYSLFTTVKGIGQKRGLRAMALPTAQLAAAIEDRDLALLQSLPEIGKRTAETIVATLRGKMDDLVGAEAAATPGGAPRGRSPAGALGREAVEVLVQLGERRPDAQKWIAQVLERDDAPRDLQALIAEVYRIKAGA